MQGPGDFFKGTANIFENDINLQEREFFKNLHQVSGKKCEEYIGTAQDAATMKLCRNEVMVAASCVLLNKTSNQYGDWRNNVRLCKNEINIVKKNLNSNFPQFPEEKFDKWLSSLDLSVRSFI